MRRDSSASRGLALLGDGVWGQSGHRRPKIFWAKNPKSLVSNASMDRRTKFSRTCRTDGLGRRDRDRSGDVGYDLDVLLSRITAGDGLVGDPNFNDRLYSVVHPG